MPGWAALPAWLLAVQILAAASPARIFVEPFGNKPGAAELRVPLEVSVGTGRSWADAAH